ncbi:MAG TPA: carbohydrate-binding domain-containing protein, partial [Demequina sp.]|nr:carbohydrate-binding domain-containing protein [Demequina sp.]
MRNPATLFASLTIAGALLISGCSAGTGTAAGADGATTAVGASSMTGAVSELAYTHLGVPEAELLFDMADAVSVTLADGASSGGKDVSVLGDTVTLTAAGTYAVTGSLTSGSLVVDAPDAVVNLVLDGVDITAADVAAINVADAGQVVVWLADGSVNTLADASGAVVDDSAAVDDTAADSPNATLFSTADLWIAGRGALSVTAHANDGITSKDSLVIAGGAVTVTAADDGLRGKDHLVVAAGTLTVTAAGDALKSDNGSVTDQPDATVGVIWIADGTLDLTSGSDGADAARQVTITGGDLTIAAGDDGLHSDAVLRIDGGTIAITESVEGIEGAYMYLSGGDVTVAASDDGINVSGGLEALETTADVSATVDQGMAVDPGMPADQADGMPGRPGPGMAPDQGTVADPAVPVDQAPGMQGGPDSQFDTAATVDDITTLTVAAMVGSGFGGPAEADNGTRFLEFSGGTYVVDTQSDGVDVNGSMTMTGGTLVV